MTTSSFQPPGSFTAPTNDVVHADTRDRLKRLEREVSGGQRTQCCLTAGMAGVVAAASTTAWSPWGAHAVLLYAYCRVLVAPSGGSISVEVRVNGSAVGTVVVSDGNFSGGVALGDVQVGVNDAVSFAVVGDGNGAEGLEVEVWFDGFGAGDLAFTGSSLPGTWCGTELATISDSSNHEFLDIATTTTAAGLLVGATIQVSNASGGPVTLNLTGQFRVSGSTMSGSAWVQQGWDLADGAIFTSSCECTVASGSSVGFDIYNASGADLNITVSLQATETNLITGACCVTGG